MSVLDFFARNKISRDSAFRITEQGKERLADGISNTDSRWRVLVALESSGSGNSYDIARAGHLTAGQVERILPSLVKQGLVIPISASQISEAMND